jgi:DNA processing protein
MQFYGEADQVFRYFDPREVRLPPAVSDKVQNPRQLQRQVNADLEWLSGEDCLVLKHGDPGYPIQLESLSDAPFLLFVWGESHHLEKHQLAIVGSRKPTPYGLSVASEMANQLAAVGLAITSGLAIGIDAAAHRGALSAGSATIAVQGCGIDQQRRAEDYW